MYPSITLHNSKTSENFGKVVSAQHCWTHTSISAQFTQLGMQLFLCSHRVYTVRIHVYIYIYYKHSDAFHSYNETVIMSDRREARASRQFAIGCKCSAVHDGQQWHEMMETGSFNKRTCQVVQVKHTQTTARWLGMGGRRHWLGVGRPCGTDWRQTICEDVEHWLPQLGKPRTRCGFQTVASK